MKKSFYFITIIFLLGFVTVYYDTIWQHESVHERIQTYEGCNNSSIHFSMIGRSYTECKSYNNRTAESINTEYILHSQNEIISYNNDSIILSMLICTFTIVSAIYWSKE